MPKKKIRSFSEGGTKGCKVKKPKQDGKAKNRLLRPLVTNITYEETLKFNLDSRTTKRWRTTPSTAITTHKHLTLLSARLSTSSLLFPNQCIFQCSPLWTYNSLFFYHFHLFSSIDQAACSSSSEGLRNFHFLLVLPRFLFAFSQFVFFYYNNNYYYFILFLVKRFDGRIERSIN